MSTVSASVQLHLSLFVSIKIQCFKFSLKWSNLKLTIIVVAHLGASLVPAAEQREEQRICSTPLQASDAVGHNADSLSADCARCVSLRLSRRSNCCRIP